MGQRSINLAMSHRGIAALESVEPATAQRFLRDAIPMRGRMIHKLSGELDSQPYDRDGQVCRISITPKPPLLINAPHFFVAVWQSINSIDRALLNEGLLDEVSASPNIRVFFNHKVIAADFDKKTIHLQDSVSNVDFSVNFDLCIGADGSYSVIRRQMMRVVR